MGRIEGDPDSNEPSPIRDPDTCPRHFRGLFNERDTIQIGMKPIAQHMDETGVTLAELVEAAELDAAVVQAIVTGNYTPSPSQRQCLATALGLTIDEIAWGHTVPVEHLYGHGPQFGRSP